MSWHRSFFISDKFLQSKIQGWLDKYEDNKGDRLNKLARFFVLGI